MIRRSAVNQQERQASFLGTRHHALQAFNVHLPPNREADVMFPCYAHDPDFFLLAMDRDGIEPVPDHSALTFAVAILALIWTTGFVVAGS